jgi:hypothetical protein
MSPSISDSRSWLQAEFVVHGLAQLLPATQIPFSCLYADVPEQELNLLEFATSQAA